jgi:hypothetical protein
LSEDASKREVNFGLIGFQKMRCEDASDLSVSTINDETIDVIDTQPEDVYYVLLNLIYC